MAVADNPPVPVAVVGTGRLGQVHARILSELDLCDLVAVVDHDIDRAREVAERHSSSTTQTAAFATIEELLDARAKDELFAAVVAVPTSAHHDVASRLIDRGVHVLVEKPISRSVDEARDLVDRADVANVTLMVGHSERFNPVIRALDGRELAPRFIDSQRVSPFPFRGSDVGVVLDMMIHDIDIILHLVRSPVVDVHAVGVAVIGEKEDLANARLLFENGSVANATASRLALKTERRIRLFSDDVYVSLDCQAKSGRIIRPGPGLTESGLTPTEVFAQITNPLELMHRRLVQTETLDIVDEEPLLAEDRAFLQAATAGTPAPVSGHDGLAAVETAERIVAAIDKSSARASGEKSDGD